MLTTACTPSDLSCSSASVIATVEQEAPQAFAQIGEYGIFDPKKSGYAVHDIRTASCTDRRCECRASVTVSLKLRDLYKGLGEGSSEADGYMRMFTPHYAQKQAAFDVRYTAELTDDTNQVYVTLYGIGGSAD